MYACLWFDFLYCKRPFLLPLPLGSYSKPCLWRNNAFTVAVVHVP